MRHLAAFGRFWYDFLVGDDWIIAATVVGAVAVTALIADDVQARLARAPARFRRDPRRLDPPRPPTLLTGIGSEHSD